MERQEQLQELRARIIQAEEDRLRGANTMTSAEAREALKNISEAVNADIMTTDELRYGNKKEADQSEDCSN